MIKKNIKVIGDIMLDEWSYVKNVGPSAETKINIFKSYKINKSLGGSGNFSMNLKALNINFKLCIITNFTFFHNFKDLCLKNYSNEHFIAKYMGLLNSF